jgi:hypothetical protein
LGFFDIRESQAVQLLFLTVNRDRVSKAREQRREGEKRRDKEGNKGQDDVAMDLPPASEEKISAARGDDGCNKTKNDLADPRSKKAGYFVAIDRRGRNRHYEISLVRQKVRIVLAGQTCSRVPHMSNF